MIRLSRLTDYAIVLMAEMARHGRGVHATAHLADRTGVPAPTVAKILKTLARDGLVASHRGAAGGYLLARDAETITIAEIITALDGPIALTACVDGAEGNCGVESLCAMRGNWDKINCAVRRALDEVSLADMMVPAHPFRTATPAERPGATSNVAV